MSDRWGYTLQHPANWLDLHTGPADSPEHDFSNEQVGNPNEMDSSGVFLAVIVLPKNGQYCPFSSRDFGVDIAKVDTTSVDGVSASVTNFGSHYFWETAVEHAGYCYMLRYFYRTAQAVPSTEVIALDMAASFRFGTVPT